MIQIKSAAQAALFCSLISLAISYFIMPFHYVVVEVKEQNFICVLKSEHFSLNWIHSVEKTHWEDHYERVKKEFNLTYTTLISFGAGTPDHNQMIEQRDGTIKLKVNQNYPEINWVISRRTQGQIKIEDHIWPVAIQFPDYSLVEFSIHHAPIWKKRGLNDCP